MTKTRWHRSRLDCTLRVEADGVTPYALMRCAGLHGRHNALPARKQRICGRLRCRRCGSRRAARGGPAVVAGLGRLLRRCGQAGGGCGARKGDDVEAGLRAQLARLASQSLC